MRPVCFKRRRHSGRRVDAPRPGTARRRRIRRAKALDWTGVGSRLLRRGRRHRPARLRGHLHLVLRLYCSPVGAAGLPPRRAGVAQERRGPECGIGDDATHGGVCEPARLRFGAALGRVRARLEDVSRGDGSLRLRHVLGRIAALSADGARVWRQQVSHGLRHVVRDRGRVPVLPALAAVAAEVWAVSTVKGRARSHDPPPRRSLARHAAISEHRAPAPPAPPRALLRAGLDVCGGMGLGGVAAAPLGDVAERPVGVLLRRWKWARIGTLVLDLPALRRPSRVRPRRRRRRTLPHGTLDKAQAARPRRRRADLALPARGRVAASALADIGDNATYRGQDRSLAPRHSKKEGRIK
mmetsp:Transcript_6358/g.20390  ORF Transcript_6358/g.20390 Transcript_6358/m.20390 type:complete len:354 (-) Transcript_6358:18-1079(-)